MSPPLLTSKSHNRTLVASRQRVFLSLLASSCAVILFFISYIEPQHLENIPRTPLAIRNMSSATSHYPFTRIDNLSRSQWVDTPTINQQSLTAVLPLTAESLIDLEVVLELFFDAPSELHEIFVTCPESILTSTRHKLRMFLTSNSTNGHRHHPEFSLYPWFDGMDQPTGVLYVAASHVSTEWVLLLDDRGLQNLDSQTKAMLLRPRSVPFPVGPRGLVFAPANISCLLPSEIPQPASYLIPPFVIPSALIQDDKVQADVAGVWASLGKKIFESNLGMFGGIVIGFEETADWCPTALGEVPSLPDKDCSGPSSPDSESGFHNHVAQSADYTGRFAVLLPSLDDLRAFSSVVCSLRASGHLVRILIFTGDSDSKEFPMEQVLVTPRCHLAYETVSGVLRPHSDTRPVKSLISEWMSTFDKLCDVVVIATEKGTLNVDLPKSVEQNGHESSVIRIPRADLPYCQWMCSLSLEEWRNWNIPRIDVSVITKDRPRSLARLFSSLSSGKFFGDSLNVRVNLEQSSDMETMDMVDNFQWDHGEMFVHHRVIHGGLLPAVVESWYPHSNDTYGLLLEDDVELSPLFYAWVKMTVLRYRYGKKGNRSPQLFGISLYQQKNLELRPEGRRPFDARVLFSDNGLTSPSSPYLSQIPCSWGAVYFPEHWREFHQYLAVRLSEMSILINTTIVPDVRSNRWTKSWKKYFIELVYLRGYVMLYPNYENFVSLSTNHLEVGSHVKDSSREKKNLFLLPLMMFPDDGSSSVGLLDLPHSTLPNWEELPVLNLTGSLTSLAALADQGVLQRNILTRCSMTLVGRYDVRNLMCVDNAAHTVP